MRLTELPWRTKISNALFLLSEEPAPVLKCSKYLERAQRVQSSWKTLGPGSIGLRTMLW